MIRHWSRYLFYKKKFLQTFGTTIVLVLLSCFCCLPAIAEPLFIETDSRIELLPVDTSIVLRQRIVHIDSRQMPFDAPPETLALNFFNDIVVYAVQVRSLQPVSDSIGKSSWYGRIELNQ